jgi:hypothetical protein
MDSGQAMQVELPGTMAGRITPIGVQVLPTVDPATHTLELRLDLPADLRASPPACSPALAAGRRGRRCAAFRSGPAVVRRAELSGVYVPDRMAVRCCARCGSTPAGRYG